MLSVLAQGLYLSLIQFYSERSQLSSLHILQLNSYNTLWPYALLSTLLEHPAKLVTLDCWTGNNPLPTNLGLQCLLHLNQFNNCTDLLNDCNILLGCPEKM